MRRWGSRSSRAPTDCLLALLRTPAPGHERASSRSRQNARKADIQAVRADTEIVAARLVRRMSLN
jgi:hypothetical protein